MVAKVEHSARRRGHPWTRSMAESTSSWQKKPLSIQDGGLALQSLVARPTVTSRLERSGGRPLYHQNGNPWSPLCLPQPC